MRNQYGGFIVDDEGNWLDVSKWLIDANWDNWFDDYCRMEDLWEDLIDDDYPVSFKEWYRTGRKVEWSIKQRGWIDVK